MRLREFNRNQQEGMAYWISPTGRIMDTNGEYHIKSVVDYPHKFGLSDEYINDLYAKYGETPPSEGKAREEIILNLARKGWIRIRVYLSRQGSYVSVTMNDLNDRAKDSLYKWANKQMKYDGAKGDKYLPVKLGLSTSGSSNSKYNVLELSQDALMMESSGYPDLVEVSSLEEFEDIPLYDFAKSPLNEKDKFWKDLKGPVKEASLGRTYQHINNKDIPVAMITAFVGDEFGNPKDSYDDNMKRNKMLAADIKNAKHFGFYYIKGGWIETRHGKETFVDEDSIFIVGSKNDNGALKGYIRKWIKEYDQNAALYKPQGSDHLFIISEDGSETDIGTFSIGAAEEGYSKIRGREFHFESEYAADKNWISRLAKAKGVK